MENILIVEDDKELNDVICTYFKNNNYNTISCLNGQEALIKLEKEKIDLMISDIMMPIMDGFTLIEKVRVKNTKLPNITTENDYNIAIILFQKTLKTIEPVLKMDFACSKSGMLHKILGDETYSNLCHISNELIYHIPSLDRVIYELNKNGMQIKDVFDFYSNRDKLPQTEDCMFFVDLISQVSDINKLIRNKYEEYISTQSTSIEASL